MTALIDRNGKVYDCHGSAERPANKILLYSENGDIHKICSKGCGKQRRIYTRNRTYVQVVAGIDRTGYMNPREIIWEDGRMFRISSVIDFRPDYLLPDEPRIDRYKIRIRDQERFLYFEYLDPRFVGRVGRWFVETVNEDHGVKNLLIQ